MTAAGSGNKSTAYFEPKEVINEETNEDEADNSRMSMKFQDKTVGVEESASGRPSMSLTQSSKAEVLKPALAPPK